MLNTDEIKLTLIDKIAATKKHANYSDNVYEANSLVDLMSEVLDIVFEPSEIASFYEYLITSYDRYPEINHSQRIALIIGMANYYSAMKDVPGAKDLNYDNKIALVKGITRSQDKLLHHLGFNPEIDRNREFSDKGIVLAADIEVKQKKKGSK